MLRRHYNALANHYHDFFQCRFFVWCTFLAFFELRKPTDTIAVIDQFNSFLSFFSAEMRVFFSPMDSAACQFQFLCCYLVGFSFRYEFQFSDIQPMHGTGTGIHTHTLASAKIKLCVSFTISKPKFSTKFDWILLKCWTCTCSFNFPFARYAYACGAINELSFNSSNSMVAFVR